MPISPWVDRAKDSCPATGQLDFLIRENSISRESVDASNMTNVWAAHKANELHPQNSTTPLTAICIWRSGWSDVRHSLLALAAAGLLISCGGGSGGGTVTAPPAPKALEILSAVVDENEKAVDASQPVDPRATIRFAFSANLSAAGIGADRVQLSDGTRTYPINTVIAGTTLTVKPTGNLHTSLHYTLTVKAGATSADGNVLKSDYVFSFRTVVAVFEAKQLTQADRYVDTNSETRILITDINGDGRPDFVKRGKPYVADGRSNLYTLSIFLQNSAGGFDNFQKLEYVLNRSTYGALFNGLVVQDIDGDNKPELLVPESPSDFDLTAVPGIRIFKAGAEGKYFAHDFIATPYAQSLRAMDVDGDGLLDLLGHRGETSYDRTSAFQILRNTGSGFTKLAPVGLPKGDFEFGLSDLDMDGKRELIVNRVFYDTGPTKSELLIFSQNAPATFSTNTALTNEAAGFCTFADTCKSMGIVEMNGDSNPELVFVGRRNLDAGYLNAVFTFNRASGGGINKVSQVTLDYGNFYGHVFAIHDMDGDAVPDLLAFAAGYFGILEGGSNFSWAFSNKIKIPVSETMYPNYVAIGDIDGDGLPDIICDTHNSGIVVARQVDFRRR